MNKLITVLRRVILNDPIYFRDIDSSRSQISSKQELMFLHIIMVLALEGCINLGSLFLIDFPVQLVDLSINQELQGKVMEVHRCTSSKEHNNPRRLSVLKES